MEVGVATSKEAESHGGNFTARKPKQYVQTSEDGLLQSDEKIPISRSKTRKKYFTWCPTTRTFSCRSSSMITGSSRITTSRYDSPPAYQSVINNSTITDRETARHAPRYRKLNLSSSRLAKSSG